MKTMTRVCPNCGSKNVRFRSRRWYDGPLNFLETMFNGSASIRTDDGIGAIERSAMDPSFMRDRGIEEQKHKMGRRTAELFWRCPDCNEKGEGPKANFA